MVQRKEHCGRHRKAGCSSYSEWANKRLGADRLTSFSFPSEMYLSRHRKDNPLQGSTSMYLLASLGKIICPSHKQARSSWAWKKANSRWPGTGNLAKRLEVASSETRHFLSPLHPNKTVIRLLFHTHANWNDAGRLKPKTVESKESPKWICIVWY